ncbi:MAG: polyprenyl synthetase family protein [bacterium]|nr:polyprenyl synthetase family protein [bacterium]
MNIKQRYFNYLRNTAAKVDPYVKSFLERHFTLYPPARNMLLTKYRFGKPQLRPAIIRLAYELIGGKNWENIIPACATIEVLETAYYCLDDFFDQEPPEKQNRDSLILQGVGFYSIAHGMICDVNQYVSKKTFSRILNELFNLDLNTLQAGIIDSTMYGTDEQYYMKKVVGYNFWEQALKIGGLLAEHKDNDIELLGAIGLNLGKAHVIANDCWDFGKELEDFRMGKSTLPIIFALENTTGNESSTLKVFLGKKNLSDYEIHCVRRIIVRCGAIIHGKQEALKLCASAIKLLKQFPDSEAKQLIEFSTTYTQRNKYYSLLEQYK